MDRRCRESEGKAKIEGYMSVSDEEAHQRDIFTSWDIFTNATKQRFLAMMNHSEPFLFHFDLYVLPRFYIDLIYFSSILLLHFLIHAD